VHATYGKWFVHANRTQTEFSFYIYVAIGALLEIYLKNIYINVAKSNKEQQEPFIVVCAHFKIFCLN
jgi:hypothetical protein